MRILSFSVKKVVQQRKFMIDCVPCTGTVRRLTAQLPDGQMSFGVDVSSGQIVKSEQGERFPLPSPFPLPPLSFFLTPSFPFLSPSLPLPSLHLEVGPLNPDRVWGSAVSSVSGVWGGGEPQPKSNSVHLPFWP